VHIKVSQKDELYFNAKNKKETLVVRERKGSKESLWSLLASKASSSSTEASLNSETTKPDEKKSTGPFQTTTRSNAR